MSTLAYATCYVMIYPPCQPAIHASPDPVPDLLCSQKRGIRVNPLPAKPKKEPKLRQLIIQHPSQRFKDSVQEYGTLTVEVGCFKTFLQKQLWGALRRGATGGKKKVAGNMFQMIYTSGCCVIMSNILYFYN